jgi:inhibitor of cysteine peptidase
MRIAAIVAVVVGIALVLGVAGCSASAVAVEKGDDGGDVTLGIGQVLDVHLPSNPSTGYAWQIVECPDFLTPAEVSIFESDAGEGVVGAGGVETWRFTGASTGTGTLVLEYRQAWEPDVPAEDTYEITVTVR